MKPSERIKEIHYQGVKAGFDYTFSDAIIAYLDEQYEQQKPCEHKNTEDIYGIKHCLDCHLVGNF